MFRGFSILAHAFVLKMCQFETIRQLRDLPAGFPGIRNRGTAYIFLAVPGIAIPGQRRLQFGLRDIRTNSQPGKHNLLNRYSYNFV